MADFLLNNPKLQSSLDANTNSIVNVVDPTLDQDAATKKYADDADALLVPYTGATGDVDLGANDLTTTGNLAIRSDAGYIDLGAAADDYKIQWDGSDAVHTITAGDFVFTGGNVGIGTASPGDKLEVKVDSSSAVNNALRLSNTALVANQGIGTGIVFYNPLTPNDGSVYNSGRFYSAFDGNSWQSARYSFQTPTGVDTWTNVLNLKNGNVGVKSEDPLLPLYVAGTVNAPATSGTTPTGIAAFTCNNNNELYFGAYNDPPYGLWLQGSSKTNLALTFPIILNPNGGNVGIGVTDPDKKLEINGSARLSNDSDKFYFGAVDDGYLQHTGSGLEVVSDNTTATDHLLLRGGTNGIDFQIGAAEQITLTDGKLAPTTDNDIDLGDATHRFKEVFIYDGIDTVDQDLTIDCGTNKTLVLAEAVWDDLRTPVNTVKLDSIKPPTEIAYKGGQVLAFASNTDNKIYFNVQLPHEYKLGSNIEFHIHIVLPTAGAGTETAENVKFDFTHSWAKIGATFPAESTVSATRDVKDDAADTHILMEIAGTIDGSAIDGVSSMLLCSLNRDVSVANDYAYNVYLLEVDFHYQIDTMGSRQEAVK